MALILFIVFNLFFYSRCEFFFFCVSAGVESGKPTHFTVYAKGAGKAPLDVKFSGPNKEPVQGFEVIDNYDYSYTVKYTPVQQVRFIYSSPVLILLVIWLSY